MCATFSFHFVLVFLPFRVVFAGLLFDHCDEQSDAPYLPDIVFSAYPVSLSASGSIAEQRVILLRRIRRSETSFKGWSGWKLIEVCSF
jgi:hypothetical protein